MSETNPTDPPTPLLRIHYGSNGMAECGAHAEGRCDAATLTNDPALVTCRVCRGWLPIVVWPKGESPEPPSLASTGAAEEPRWQPIETAPKEQRVLVALKRQPLETVTEIAFGYFVMTLPDQPDGVWTCDETGVEIVPTHWLPLPAAPDAAAARPGSPDRLRQVVEPLVKAAEDAIAFLNIIDWNDSTSERNAGDVQHALEVALSAVPASPPLPADQETPT